MKIKAKKAQGKATDGIGEAWETICPDCEKLFRYTGWFDSGDVTECSCGCKFTTSRVWINEKTYIE